VYMLSDERGRLIDTAEDQRSAVTLAEDHGFPRRDTILGLHRTGEHSHNGMLLADLGSAEPVPDADPAESAPFTFA
jgi:hypothetical protein